MHLNWYESTVIKNSVNKNTYHWFIRCHFKQLFSLYPKTVYLKKYTTLTESTTSCHQQYLICKMLWKVTNNGPTHTVVGALIFACNFEIRLKPISNWVRKLTQTSNFGWIVECFGAESYLSKKTILYWIFSMVFLLFHFILLLTRTRFHRLWAGFCNIC